jgi:glycosyltransferase involved in cell wall biosynthesis
MFFISNIANIFFKPETWLYKQSLRHITFLKRITFIGVLLLYPIFCLLSWIRIILRKLFFLRPAILWSPTPILTIAESSAILRRLGYPSKTLVYTVYYITDKFDYNLSSLIQNPGISWWLPHYLFLWSLVKFDIFHFFYDGGLWSGMRIIPEAKWLELPLLRLAGKRIIASAYGADVRTKSLNEMWQPYNICYECPEPGMYCICDGSAGLSNSRYYRYWCNAILAMGDMHDFVFKSRKNFNYWPIDVKKVPFVGVSEHKGPLRVVHSPNHRHFKGTKYIETAIANLKMKGNDIELDLVEKISNKEAKRRYAKADIVFAQCLCGWIGYTEIEGMAAGKPVITYIRNAAYLEHMSGSPAISANPENLEKELEKLVENLNLRQELGRQGREFVEKYWSYEALAPHYDELHQTVWRQNNLLRALRIMWDDFVKGETHYRVGLQLQGHVLGEWPVHSDPFINLARIHAGCYGQPPLDDEGIPRMFYAGNYVEHPGVIALYGLNHFHALLQHPDSGIHKNGFLVAARWLRDHLVIEDRQVGRWLYNFEPIGRKMDVPWVSCFSQALGLSILLRAHQMKPDGGFGEHVDVAANLMRLPVHEGGVLHEDNGLVFLEEYPENSPSHVLNGWITGMFGLHEYYRVTGSEWAGGLFDRCLQSLRKILPQYEAKNGLRYDLSSDAVVNVDYYYFIVQQMFALHRITADISFRKYGRKWKSRLYKQKVASIFKLNSRRT